MSFCLHNSQVCNLCHPNQCHTTLVDQGSALGYISMCAASKAPGQKAAVLTTTIILHQCSNWATLVKISNRINCIFWSLVNSLSSTRILKVALPVVLEIFREWEQGVAL